jgi:hypothetical protein
MKRKKMGESVDAVETFERFDCSRAAAGFGVALLSNAAWKLLFAKWK